MFDVVVVGAGFSGLQAALSAQKAGLSVAIVEARDRIFKQRLGETAVMVLEDGKRIEFPHGITPEFSSKDKKNLEMIHDHIQAESLQPNGLGKEDDQVSLDQYVRNLGARPKTLAMVNLWVRVMHGLESTEESAAWFIEYCRTNHGLLAIRADDVTGSNYMRIKSGTQSIAKGIANLVGHANIHLNEPVASIQDNTSHVVVKTTTGKAFKAKKLIISMPSAMLKELNFSPPLPQRAQEVYNNTKLGHYKKAIAFYEKPWWRDLGYNGFFMDYQGPACVVRDTSFDDVGLYGFTCFVNGKAGEEWAAKYPHERRKLILDQIARAFDVGPDSVAYRPMEFVEQIWQHEQFSRGALAPVTKIGHLTEYADIYGKPIGNTHFVGTEHAKHWKGYLEGALASGEVGAKEVIEALEQQLPKSRL
ncbi:hypothetical protein N0V84_011247 [Fusarium piperis]|uniref:monoamine oxidase n=1 Tax=Fusarium piperis TaxID=1435070 RepID=A0A9W8TE00_9HYPO|nr:hypothetical protein N0V84_011247 [Fusarium piperis]